MQGMFRANGGCGYVKKPEILMQNFHCDHEFDPTRIMPVKKTLKVCRLYKKRLKFLEALCPILFQFNSDKYFMRPYLVMFYL